MEMLQENIVRNKTIIGLKCRLLFIVVGVACVRNKTIIGLKLKFEGSLFLL